MLKYDLTIGICTLRRDLPNRPPHTPWNWDSAEARGREAVSFLEANFGKRVRFVTTAGIGQGDLVYDRKSAMDLARRFLTEPVDGWILINCNFGNEEAAGDLAEAVKKPVLLFAPLDTEYAADGQRVTDAQCGLFGVGRQLQRLGIPFSHVPSCRMEDTLFHEGFDRFLRVCCMLKNFRGMRVGMLGNRPLPFSSVMFNESQLLEKFGIRVVPVNFAILRERMKSVRETKAREIEEAKANLAERFAMDEPSREKWDGIAALTVLYRSLFEEFDLDVLTGECWTATPKAFDGVVPCAAYGLLAEEGYIVSCESDVHAAVTMALLKCATLGEGTPILGEFTVRHPKDPNAELLWHCGPFPASLSAPGCAPRLVNQRVWLRARDGVYTAARMDQDRGDYRLFPLTCETATGPDTSGSYIWASFDDLAKVEKAVMEGPYIHHFAEIEGDWTEVLSEFTKYVPDLTLDTL